MWIGVWIEVIALTFMASGSEVSLMLSRSSRKGVSLPDRRCAWRGADADDGRGS